MAEVTVLDDGAAAAPKTRLTLKKKLYIQTWDSC